MGQNRWKWLAISSALLAACDLSGGGSQPSPTLVLTDSVVLAEEDSSYLGRPGDVVVTPRGSFLVADGLNGTVHEYAADGRRIRGIGRRGHGPNEFPVSAFLLALTLLNDRVVYQNIDTARRRTFVSLMGAADSLLPGGPFPAPLGSHPLFAAPGISYMRAAQLGHGDSIAAALQTSDYLFFGTYTGSSYDSVHVPVLKRQGSRPDLQQKFMLDPSSAGADVYAPSLPTAIVRLSSGQIAYVTSDIEFIGNHFAGRIFVSLVDRRRQRSCPDAQVPVPADPLPHVTFRGDTLLVLTQEIRATDAPALIRKYLIDGNDCAWITGTS